MPAGYPGVSREVQGRGRGNDGIEEIGIRLLEPGQGEENLLEEPRALGGRERSSPPPRARAAPPSATVASGDARVTTEYSIQPPRARTSAASRIVRIVCRPGG